MMTFLSVDSGCFFRRKRYGIMAIAGGKIITISAAVYTETADPCVSVLKGSGDLIHLFRWNKADLNAIDAHFMQLLPEDMRDW